jgi:hypothetical protein
VVEAPRFPKYDLKASIEGAQNVRAKSADGATASQDELAVFLGYTSRNSGAYLTRLSALRQFGLVGGRGAVLHLTERAIAILEPDLPATGDQAKLDAFFDVPLFVQFFDRYGGGNRELPDESGMKHAMTNFFHVPADQASTALRVLLDSADEAGLFRVAGNRTRMIRPTLGAAKAADTDKPTAIASEAARLLASASVAAPRPTGPRASKIIDGVLDLLPADEWDESSLREWLAFFENALRLYYKLPKGPSDKPSPWVEVVKE